MKIYKLLNPYKLLCEAEQLDEALSTDFKIGFEMEGVCTREGFNSYMLPGYHSQSQPSGVVAELFDDINETLGFGKGKIERDGSLRASPEKGGWTFEYGSPIIDFNPTNINKIYHFLKKVPELQIYTNETCSFHTHMSFKDLDKINGAWVMCCLAIDEEMQETLRHLKTKNSNIDFFHGKWARTYLFDNLKEYLINHEYKEISRLLDSTDKYNLVRVHPAGTLEWRGPRNFLNDSDIEAIHGYILKLYKVIVKLSQIVNAQTYSGSGITINRKEIESQVSITRDFKSPAQNKKDAKINSLSTAIQKNPLILTKISNDKFKDFFNEYPNKIAEYFWYDADDRDGKPKIILGLNNYKINFIINEIYKGGNLTTVLKLYNLLDINLNDKLNDDTKKNVINSLLKSLFQNQYSGNVFKQLFKDYEVMDNKYLPYIYEFINDKDISESLIRFIKQLQENFDFKVPMEFWKKLLNSNKFYYISRFNEIPAKVQRMMVRRSPYMVQYINNLDPQILNSLKQKYPNIEDYTLGVL